MKEINVAVTGGAGQIAYSLLPRLVSGETFGPDTKVNLRLIEIPQVVDKLQGTIMELIDCGFDQTGDLTATSDIKEGVKDADWVLLVGSIPRGIVIDGKKIEERSDLLKINGGIFTDQGSAIGELAKSDARILVVGNPANTNALIGMNKANNPSQQWFAMTALDANRAKAQLAEKANVEISSVKNMVIWGNHSPTMYPDPYNATIDGQSAAEVINDSTWIEDEYLPLVQQRGKAVIDARGASSAASAANAAIDTVKSVMNPTNDGDCFSAAIVSDGSYSVPEGLIFGFPLRTTEEGKVEIIQGIELNEFAQTKIKVTTDELESEREAVADLIS
ncbi:malate dehydrogenase [Gammaproteobacteria bacterium]|nr:malate dehydrogenase [Gammaproteobacteria bacterium]MDB4816314.1 malate dehydrogenase [Gammaproteobacteria bacterium]MDC0546339.1 malate dehydrogenase [Gammaproteobacteria bacterium]